MHVFLARFADGCSAVADLAIFVCCVALSDFFVVCVLYSWSLNLFQSMDSTSDLLRSCCMSGRWGKKLVGRLAGVDRIMIDVVLQRNLLSAISIEETIA